MTDPMRFSYTIENYDPTKREIKVVFGDGSYAFISLFGSIPTSGEELDRLVAQFTPKIEQVQAIKLDDYFIKGVVGLEREADRISFAPPATSGLPVGGGETPAEMQALGADEEAWVRSIVEKALVEKGLVKDG